MKNNFGHSWRAYLIYVFLGISLLILVWRIASLQYIEGDFLTSKGKSMLETTRSIPANRGSIFDRNNFPLAVSIKQYDLYALKNFSEKDFSKLSNILPRLAGIDRVISSMLFPLDVRKSPSIY